MEVYLQLGTFNSPVGGISESRLLTSNSDFIGAPYAITVFNTPLLSEVQVSQPVLVG